MQNRQKKEIKEIVTVYFVGVLIAGMTALVLRLAYCLLQKLFEAGPATVSADFILAFAVATGFLWPILYVLALVVYCGVLRLKMRLPRK